MNEQATDQNSLGEKLAGKYLTFKLDEEEYGLAILKVQEIIRMQDITRVPKAPHFFKGVINLRGKVIPIISLSLKFEIPEQEETELTCIVVVQIIKNDRETIMGIVIDEVREVLDIQPQHIENPPDFGSQINTEFIQGMGKVGEKVKMLLDIDKVLNSEEINEISQISK